MAFLDQFTKHLHILLTKIVQRLKSHMVSFYHSSDPAFLVPVFVGKERSIFRSQFQARVHRCDKVKPRTANSHITPTRAKVKECVCVHLVVCCAPLSFYTLTQFESPGLGNGTAQSGMSLPMLLNSINPGSHRHRHRSAQCRKSRGRLF